MSWKPPTVDLSKLQKKTKEKESKRKEKQEKNERKNSKKLPLKLESSNETFWKIPTVDLSKLQFFMEQEKNSQLEKWIFERSELSKLPFFKELTKKMKRNILSFLFFLLFYFFTFLLLFVLCSERNLSLFSFLSLLLKSLCFFICWFLFFKEKDKKTEKDTILSCFHYSLQN